MIQARHPTFNIEYGTYVKPLQVEVGERVDSMDRWIVWTAPFFPVKT
jgi:hypothetical protein